MNKITFLFGAGASCNALPMVKDIPERLEKLIGVLNSPALLLDDNTTFEGLKTDSPKTKREYQKNLIDDLRWLVKESVRHSSVDTLAKRLTIRRQFSDLERLKKVLSVFFIFEQAQKPPDERYDTFYASIIDSSGILDENIRIISWNYDYQFEFAYSEYCGKNAIGDIQSRLNIKQKKDPALRFNQRFSIYKLNGSTELFTPIQFGYFSFIDEIITALDKNFVEIVVKNYAGIIDSKNVESTLSFAWESDNKFKDSGDFVNSVLEDVKDSIALVIIGYSFPFFNREIDRKIIGGMSQLQKVYFQSPEANSLKDRFKAIRFDFNDNDLVCINDIKQFFLPPEL